VLLVRWFLPLILILSFNECLIQAQSASSILAGVVRDDSGSPLPGTVVSAINTATGLERSDITSDSGSYRIPSLPVGIYDLTAQIQGFATQVQKDIPLDVGRTVIIDFVLRFAIANEIVNVDANPPLIEKNESHLATIVNPEQIANLPLNDRQFANLAVLAPGTSLVSNPDSTRFRSLAVGLMGASGRNMNVTIDSGDNNDDTIGGINQFYPLESIAEFNFLTSRYKAEYSRASGGVLNVVTRSGTNDLHGSAFIFFRDEALNALSRDEKEAGITDPSEFSREQFGGSFGGPIQKNKLHFFVAFEREQLDVPIIFNTFGEWPEYDGQYDWPTRHSLSTGKFTANLNPKNYLVVRYGQQKSSSLYNVNVPDYAPTAWATISNKLHSILVSHNYLFANDQLNELLFQYADFKSDILPNSNDPLEFFYGGTVYLAGQSLYCPQRAVQEKYQFKDDLSWTSTVWKGNHHFKTGINVIHEPRVGSEFNLEPPLTYVYAGTNRDSPIVSITQQEGILNYDFPNNQYGVYFQDDWNISDQLTLNLGVRYDYVTGFNLDQSQNSLYQELVAAPFDYPWLDPVKENPSGKVSNDTNNIAPRLGGAYDLNGDGTTVIRAGWGVYYDFPFTNGNLLWPNAALSNTGLIYRHEDFENGILNPDGTLFRVGDPLPPNQLNGYLRDSPNEVASPDFVVPYTRQFSIGFSHLIGENTAIDLDYVNAAGRDRFLRFRFTLNPDEIFPNQSPRFHYNGAFHDYNALNVTIRSQFSTKFQLQSAYTFSKVTGNSLPASDDFRLRLAGICPDCALDYRIGPKDDPRMVGPLNTDVRHRVVIAGVVEMPLKFLLSGIFRANSAPPYNAFIPADTDGDGFPYSIVDSHVNSRRGSGFSQLDLRINKIFSIRDAFQVETIFEVFNLFNADNPGPYIGNMARPDFGHPLGYGEPRGAQLGTRIVF